MRGSKSQRVVFSDDQEVAILGAGREWLFSSHLSSIKSSRLIHLWLEAISHLVRHWDWSSKKQRILSVQALPDSMLKSFSDLKGLKEILELCTTIALTECYNSVTLFSYCISLLRYSSHTKWEWCVRDSLYVRKSTILLSQEVVVYLDEWRQKGWMVSKWWRHLAIHLESSFLWLEISGIVETKDIRLRIISSHVIKMLFRRVGGSFEKVTRKPYVGSVKLRKSRHRRLTRIFFKISWVELKCLLDFGPEILMLLHPKYYFWKKKVRRFCQFKGLNLNPSARLMILWRMGALFVWLVVSEDLVNEVVFGRMSSERQS